MQDHLHFGAPPKLRPRTAGASRSALPRNDIDYGTTATSTSTSAPEQLASTVNALKESSSSLLRQRLQSPRPGSAAALQTPRAPASRGDKGMFMKPPMRPKSATTASRVSRHRMQLVQDVTMQSSNNQSEDSMTREEKSASTVSEKEDSLRLGLSSTPTYSKRPFSASAASGSYRSIPSTTSNQRVETTRDFASAGNTTSGMKRPHSAAASTRYHPFRAREKSSSSLTSCLSVVSHATKTPRSTSASSSRSGYSRGDRLLASTRESADNTFVYAVPRHFLEPGLPYDPYDIIPITHDALFGGGSVNQLQDAHWDYYTISRSGYTFHLKRDEFQPSFLSLGDWEMQKTQFTKLRTLSTFSAFRYRKVFRGWRQLIRSTKRETARENLMSECYFSYPVLLKGMLEVRTELVKLSKLQLMWNFDGETMCLQDFSSANVKFIKTRTKELRHVTTRIQNILAEVCQAFLDDTAPLHAGFPGHEFTLSVRKSSNFHILESYVQCEQGLASAHQQLMQHKHFRSARLTTSDAAETRAALLLSSIEEHGTRSEKLNPHSIKQDNELEDIRWTMASIKRRKCRQLTKFVMLVDFLLLDTFARVVKQSLELLSSFLLRGANAGTVRNLADRDDLMQAMHHTISSARKNSIQSVGEGSVDNSNYSQARQFQRTPLTKQQIKAFLHSAWEGKFRTQTSPDEDNSAALSELPVVAMENRLEALLLHVLTKVSGTAAEAFSMDDLFLVSERTLPQLLVLPHFTTSNLSIYTTPNTAKQASATSTANKRDESGKKGLLSTLEHEVLVIPCLRRQPLFAVNFGVTVKTEKRGRRSYQVCFKPELVDLVRTLQSIIIGFTEVFRDVPPLLSSPELRSVLNFADDIRALNLHPSFKSKQQRADSTQRRVSVQFEMDGVEDTESDNVSAGEDGEEHFRCPADRLLERMEEDGSYLSVRDEIQDLTRSALHGAEELASCYSKVLEHRQQNESVNFDIKARQFRRNEYTLEQMQEDAAHFTNQLSALEALQLFTDVEFLHFDMHQLQADLLPSPVRCLDAMRELLPKLARERCDQFLHYISISSAKIEKPVVQNLDQFAKYLLNLREVYDEILDKELDLTFLHNFFQVLDTLKFAAPIETAKAFELCDPEFQALKSHVQEEYTSRDTDMQNYGPLLAENLNKLERRLSWLQSTASDQEAEAQSSTCQDARDRAAKLYHEATEMQQEASRLTRIQKIFEEASNDLRPPSKTFEHLNVLAAELKLKSELWEAVCEADEHLELCSTNTLRSVDLDAMGVVASHVDRVVENIRQCSSHVVGAFELDRLEKLQTTLHGLAPIVRDLRNPHLAERHWTKLEHKMQCSLVPIVAEVTENSDGDQLSTLDSADSTETFVSSRLDLQVQQLLSVNAVAHGTTIRHVSEEASAEAAIAGSFMSVVRTWEMQELPVEPKKDRDGRDVFCIGDCVELTSLIEESQVLLRVMDLSTYSLVIQERLPKMLHDLEHTKESLELLQMCQRKWDYTQRLVSIDFARTFPEQAKQLQKYDGMWRSLTLGLYNRSLCLPFGVSPEHRQTLKGILEGFEAAAKTLADHLLIKRQVFPAFFKLSDLELATLLSKCRDVGCIPSFLFQCFDNVGQIVFGTRDAFQDILQIISRVYGDTEVIPMGKNLKARGPVEQWLASVEKRLAEQLRRSTKQAIEILSQHDNSGLSPKLDARNFPIQAILLADRVVRCAIIENGLQSIITMGNNKFEQVASQLAVYSTSVKNQIQAVQHRGSAGLQTEVPVLTPREITLRACLCLQEIHFRDAFASHVASQQSGPALSLPSSGLAIDWEHQLKYRMDDATTVGHECHVEMNTLNIPYGFTYLNPSQDSVVTPGSFRSLFSLFACIRHAQGCFLTGPSESGKRTLATQVGSMLGRRTFVASISSYSHATRLLVGALHAGGTFCASLQFAASETSAPLIKTLATTLASIEHAVLTKNQIVGLHRSPITFVPGTAMLVILPSTTHLSVADTQDIKVWTESLCHFAVIQWDRMYIVEALLSSRGFSDPRETAKQLLILWQQARSSFNFAQERPSSFDTPFSFSALKTIVIDAATQLEAAPTQLSLKMSLNFQQILLRESVLRYFQVRVDGEQLKALEITLENVFPNTNVNAGIFDEWRRFQATEQQKQTILSPELQESVSLALTEMHFVPRKKLLASVASLSDALAFSTSTVLVGPSGVGKTSSYQVLAKAVELCLQKRDQRVTSATQEAKPEQSPVRTTLAVLSKRSNSFLTSKCEKNLQASVAVNVVFPMALTLSQLYGGVTLDGRGRIPSIVGQLIREAQDVYAPTAKPVDTSSNKASDSKPMKSLLDFHNQVWVVFDDALDLRWFEALLAVLSNPSPLLGFQDGEYMTLPPNLRIVFEVLQLRHATPRFLHSNAILPLTSDDPEDTTTTSKSRRMRNMDPFSRMSVATAYVHRYLEIQREQAVMQNSEAVKPLTWSPVDTFNVVERWLLKTSLVLELTAVLDGINGAVHLSQLQRVTNLTSMLQSLISTASSLPEPARTTTSDKGKADPTKFAEDLSLGQTRVEMALVYSLLWGFAASAGDQGVFQRQISDMVRREFEHLTPAWISCGVDVNLFETLLDLQELRFVPVTSVTGQPAISLHGSNSGSHGNISTLFVPTLTSLVVHAAVKEALRSGRGILLLGGDSARRTTLARNFIAQLDVIRSIISKGGVSNMLQAQTNEDEGDKTRNPDAETKEAATLASVKRIRLRQISLVTWMALRLQKDSNGADNGLQTSRNASVASIATTSDNQSLASVVEAEEGIPLAIAPSIDHSKTAMVRQFDRGDVIPFFFAMPHATSNSGDGNVATELANCLERMLQRERTGVFEPPPGKTALLILDDLHLAIPEQGAASSSLQLPVYPSVYTYLRYVHERGTVYHGASCLPTSVENLMLFMTMRSEFFPNSSVESTRSAQEEPLCKLTSKFFPIVTPSCGLEELHHIFGQALETHWGVNNLKSGAALATTVRFAFPLVYAATTVLWDRLRATYKFCLQDLARVYEGLAGVGLSLLPDVETLLRLWTHECNRTLREPSLGLTSHQQDDEVTGEISRMRSLISQVAQRRASARASRLSLGPEAGLNFLVAAKRQSVQAAQPANDENASLSTLLALFAARSAALTSSKSNVKYNRFSQQFSTLQEQKHHAAMAGGLWAYVPANIYYNGVPNLTSTQGEGDGNAGSDAAALSERVKRRSSASFMRQQSLEGDEIHRTLGRNGRWIYAEISFEDDSEIVSTASVQGYYRELQHFSSTVMTPRSSKTTISLPRDVSPVPFALAQVLARVDRVFARPAARLILLDNSNGAVDPLLRFSNSSRLSEFQQVTHPNGAIFTMSGLQDDDNVNTSSHTCLTLRWKRLLLEIYERVGVAGQEATLVVKRLDLLPLAMVNQLQALMTTGEVPGLLSLEEQVHLATRVCDERLLEMKTKHRAQVAQIRAEAESTRDQALAILHQKQRDAPTTPLLEAFQFVEVQYQRELRSKLARVDLRWQQDSDDLRREREVESESVAATVMALTRPLGVTSGKWASAVARMCSKLRVVLVIDKKHENRVRSSSPNVFATCDLVSVPQLDRNALRTLVYGHFHAQFQQLLRDHRGGNNPTEHEAQAGLLDFLHQTQRTLWSVVCMATDMHLAVVEAHDNQQDTPLVRAFAMASIFIKLIVDSYKREEAVRAKASWFLDLSNRLDRDLGALRSSDVLLSEQLTSIDQQLTTQTAKLVEQKEDAERIRVIMQRFQVAADEQIQVTNEAQEVAQRELREPMACLEEANRALLLVDRRHIVEIKSFVNPPPLVHMVLGAVCVLFQLEPSWESARRLLLGDANVVQTLLQFNKDAVTAATLAKLNAEYLRDQRFCREEVERQSVAAASMVGWVRAIYQYASARHQVQPTLDKLEKAQTRLNLIMQEFQVSKQRVVEADEAWQATQAVIDAATTRKEALVGEIASLDARCDSGGHAMEALQDDRKRQQEAASASSMRRGFSLMLWNALLSAGALAYACELCVSSRRQQVFEAWEAAYCSYGGLTPGCPPTSTCCAFVPSIAVVLKDSVLSSEHSKGEQVNLQEFETPLTALFSGDYPEDCNAEAENAMKLVTGIAGVGFSQRRLWDAWLLSLVATTPALPVVMITHYSSELEELLVTCARRVWNWHQLRMVYARAPDFDDELRSAARFGHQLLVLDVDPLHSEPQFDSDHGICLHTALSWTTTHVNGTENLVVLRKTREVDWENEDDTVDTEASEDFIPLHSNFRLILTSHASRVAFGEALDMIPTLDAELHSSDVGDVMLDKLWSSSALKSSEGSDFERPGGLKLKTALREHGRLAQQFEASHTQLTKLLEAAAVASQFPLTQTQALRDRLAAIQEARQVLRDQRREIQEQLRLVKRQCTPTARTAAAVFNAFNRTVRSSGPNASPPLTLQVFLPILLSAVAVTSNPSAPAPTTPLKDAKRPSSRYLLARTATNLVFGASSRGQIGFVGVPSDVLTKLLVHLAPLVPPASPRGEWHRFLLQLIVALEEMQPATQKMLHTPVQEGETSQTQEVDAEAAKPRSVNTILLQTKLRAGGKRDANVSSITAETCKALEVASSRTDLQRRVVNMLFNGCKTESSSVDAENFDEMVRLALPEVSSRYDRLRAALVLFPELIHHVCDRVLAAYGVPLNFYQGSAGITNLVHTPSESEELESQEGFWLRTMRSLPEETAVLVLTKHDFHSFTFARRVFFHGIEGSTAIQTRVLQWLAERQFRVTGADEEAAAVTRINSEETVPLAQLYVLPRCVHPPEEDHEEEIRQLLLQADDFKQVAQMENTQLGTLEAVPLAVVNMNGGVPEYWEALFQILNRSCQRPSSAAFQRHDSVNLISGVLGSKLARRPSILLSENSGNKSALSPLVSMQSPSGTGRRSSQSMVRRLSAIDLVTPSYPRLVAVVENWSTLPVHLRDNIVCLRDDLEDEATASSDQPSFCMCLQSTLLRLTLHPCAQALSGLANSSEDDGDAMKSPPPDLWLVVTGLVLFHSILVFRSQVLRHTYVGSLPHVGTGAVFHYSDDVFLTAINQCLVVLTEKLHSHYNSQQRRQLDGSSTFNEVFQRRMYQQIVLTSYARMAVGQQEVAFLKKLFSECLQLVNWKDPSVVEINTGSYSPSVRGPSRQMTIRDQFQLPEGMSSSTRNSITPLMRAPSSLIGPSSMMRAPSSLTGMNPLMRAPSSVTGTTPLMRGQSSLNACPLPLGFLAVPGESLRQPDLTMSQWLGLVWGYSARFDQQINGKLHALLLGHQQTVSNRRGSLEDSSRGLVITSGGVGLTTCLPLQWMWAFGWASENAAACLGDDADLTANIPLRVAIDVLQAVIQEAVPPRFTVNTWQTVESSLTDNNDSVESEQPHSDLDVDPELKTMVSVYNQQVDATSLALEAILTNLMELNTQDSTVHAVSNTLSEHVEESDEADQTNEDEDDDDEELEDECNSLHLTDIEDVDKRHQVVLILRNEVPSDLLSRFSSPTAPTTSSWSFHDVLQHYQDWYNHLTQFGPHCSSTPPNWWLPGMLASNLPISHILDITKSQYCSKYPTEVSSTQFTLRLPPNNNKSENSEVSKLESLGNLPENTFVIIDGVVLLGASWNQETQSLTGIGDLNLSQRVQLIGSLCSTNPRTALQQVPLLGFDGNLLLECVVSVDASLNLFSTPYLVPVGSHFR